MTVTIYCSNGEGFAEWVDECGMEREEYLGEVDDNWLNNKAKKYFADMLGEEILLEIVFEDE